MNMYKWQEDMLNGLTKGQMHIISCGRQTGKSLIQKMYMETMMFSSPWSDWKEIFVLPWDRKESVTGKGFGAKSKQEYTTWH